MAFWVFNCSGSKTITLRPSASLQQSLLLVVYCLFVCETCMCDSAPVLTAHGCCCFCMLAALTVIMSEKLLLRPSLIPYIHQHTVRQFIHNTSTSSSRVACKLLFRYLQFDIQEWISVYWLLTGLCIAPHKVSSRLPWRCQLLNVRLS